MTRLGKRKTSLQSWWTRFQGKFPPVIIFYFRAIRVILLFFPCQCHLCLICIVLWVPPLLCWEISLAVKDILKGISTKPFAKVRRGTVLFIILFIKALLLVRRAPWSADRPPLIPTNLKLMHYRWSVLNKTNTVISVRQRDTKRPRPGGRGDAVSSGGTWKDTGLEERAQVCC